MSFGERIKFRRGELKLSRGELAGRLGVSPSAVSGYSHKDMSVLHTVISSYEESDIVHLILQVDPHAIINVLRTENFYGGFYRAPLD